MYDRKRDQPLTKQIEDLRFKRTQLLSSRKLLDTQLKRVNSKIAHLIEKVEIEEDYQNQKPETPKMVGKLTLRCFREK